MQPLRHKVDEPVVFKRGDLCVYRTVGGRQEIARLVPCRFVSMDGRLSPDNDRLALEKMLKVPGVFSLL